MQFLLGDALALLRLNHIEILSAPDRRYTLNAAGDRCKASQSGLARCLTDVVVPAFSAVPRQSCPNQAVV